MKGSAQPPQVISNSRRSCRRPVPAELFALVLLLAVIGLLCAAFTWLRQGWLPAGQERLNEETAAAIAGRGSRLTGLAETAGAWGIRLASGDASLADYLLRLFVSPEYLSQNADDEQFIRDASLVLTGRLPDESELTLAAGRLSDLGSRLAYLNELLAGEGYKTAIAMPADPTRLRTLTLANDRPAAGTEIVGLLPVAAEVRLTGQGACFKLYADEQLRTAVWAEPQKESVLNTYTLTWDTRQEQPGSHRLALMLLTSDGRGSWQDLDRFTVPAVTALERGATLDCRQDGGETAWYQIPSQDGQAFLTVVGSDAPLDLALIDLHQRSLCLTGGLAGQTAALRGRTADDTCYVRIETAGGAPAGYRLAASMAAAVLIEEPEQLLGVLAIRDGEIMLRKGNGEAVWTDAAPYRVYDPAGRLARLILTLPDQSEAAIAGDFDPENTRYGLYVSGDTDQLELTALTMEGNAADLMIEKLSENGDRQVLQPGEPVPLGLSENRLLLTVRGFDDRQRIYEVSILRPPHSTGYHAVLDQFPFDYRSSLWLLHVVHPAWQYVAMPAEVRWQDFIKAQDYKDRSLASTNSCPPSWIEPGSPVYDGKTWKAVVPQVIAWFADPRNFLNDRDIFQFEKLAFDPSAHNRAGLETMLKDTFMAAGNTRNIDFADILIRAGGQAGISPYYLASRILQEMGRDGRSMLSSGTLPDYEGYFNFYNIGSTPNTAVPNGALINGARFAQFGREADKGVITEDEKVWLLPWTSPERAIIGGAIWIARSYVQIGQDTLYLQKFDLVKAGGYYTHQYATNIQMAWSEARNTYKAYVDLGLLDQAFVFQIPVFADLPAGGTLLP